MKEKRNSKKLTRISRRDFIEKTATSAVAMTVLPLRSVFTGQKMCIRDRLMAYASTIREREGLRQAICRQLAMNPLKAEDIPVRRGCWLYDDILGPWQGWYEIDKDSTS